MDLGTVGGILFAIGAILLGQHLEGGHAGSLMQLTAFIIVLGGTIGACLVAFPMPDFLRGMKMAKHGFLNTRHDLAGSVREILELAAVARRDGVLALEAKLPSVKEPFLKRALQLLVDGVDASVARDTLETEMELDFEEGAAGAKVWESAGAFAPTIGILGAVLGLIHVMENLADPSKLGPGIAVAFVATVYAVGMANIFFLPIAAKVKRKLHLEKERKTVIAEGILGIQEGLNPRVLEEKLKAYMGGHAVHLKSPAK
jgi:chemotaxis protein MotA